MIFPPSGRVEGILVRMRNGPRAARLFLVLFIPCSADHERDWPPCRVVFFGLATNTLNVRINNNNNNNNNNNKNWGTRLKSLGNFLSVWLTMFPPKSFDNFYL